MWSLRIGWVDVEMRRKSRALHSVCLSRTLYLSNRSLGARTYRKLGNGQINTLIVANEFSSCMQTSTESLCTSLVDWLPHALPSPSPAQAVPIANLFVTCGRPVERNSFSHATWSCGILGRSNQYLTTLLLSHNTLIPQSLKIFGLDTIRSCPAAFPFFR